MKLLGMSIFKTDKVDNMFQDIKGDNLIPEENVFLTYIGYADK